MFFAIVAPTTLAKSSSSDATIPVGAPKASNWPPLLLQWPALHSLSKVQTSATATISSPIRVGGFLATACFDSLLLWSVSYACISQIASYRFFPFPSRSATTATSQRALDELSVNISNSFLIKSNYSSFNGFIKISAN